MRTCLLIVLLSCVGASAQTIPGVPTGPLPATATIPPSIYFINAGGPATPGSDSPNGTIPAFQTDQYFTGGDPWVDPAMGTGIWGSLRYSPSFTYDIPVPNGFYTVKFDLLEPNKTAAGQRVFTISVPGATSQPIDIFAMTKAINTPTSITMMATVGGSMLHIQFQATIGNAVVSGIEVSPSYIFSGVETHFLKIFSCVQPSQTVCIEINQSMPLPSLPNTIQ